MIKNKSVTVLMALSILGVPAYADPAKDAYKHGVSAEKHSDFDTAFRYYKQAHGLQPTNVTYFTAYTRLRANAASQHVHNGEVLRNTGSLPEALAEFQKAAEIDPTSFVAQQEARRVADMMRRQERQKTVPKIETPKLLEELSDSVQLQPLSTGAINWHMTATADVIYKTVGKLAGLNVVMDPEYKAQKITVDLSDVTLREALDMIRLQSKTYWRAMTPNTIYVTTDNPNKRKELEQNVLRTFYLRNISSPTELQEAANTLRSILDITRVQLLQAQGAMILRGTPDQMTLAEKLLADIDRPKSEVVIDVAVMQVGRDRLRTLGTNVPTSNSIGLVAGGGTASAPGVKIGGLNGGNFFVAVPSASFTALASDSNTKILQNPEIRALSDEKATLRIGDRVPIATGSFQPGIVGGGGVSPLVSTQFQYLDVGVNIDILPHIHSDRDVTLKLMLEISSVTGTESIGGITQPIIGQRRIEHITRLADGEVNLLGGILEETETQSLSGYPWLNKLPILKYLFAQETKDRRQNEIVFAITPHIVRSQEFTEDSTRQIDIGTGNSIELRRKPAAAAPADHTSDSAKSPAAPQAALEAPLAPARAK
jgi:general secretion pathway protein D